MRYEAVIFDLGGTLIRETTQAEKNDVVRQIAEVLSAPPDDLITIWNASFNEQMKGSGGGYKNFIRNICGNLGINIDDDLLIESTASILLDSSKKHLMRPRQNAIKILRYLKLNNIKTGLISNCNADVPEIWEETPFARLIDVALFSCSEGLMKPDPRIYQLAMEKLVVTPGKCLYVADGINDELAAASRLGMYAVMLKVPDENENDPYREEWDGPVIKSLKELLPLL